MQVVFTFLTSYEFTLATQAGLLSERPPRRVLNVERGSMDHQKCMSQEITPLKRGYFVISGIIIGQSSRLLRRAHISFSSNSTGVSIQPGKPIFTVISCLTVRPGCSRIADNCQVWISRVRTAENGRGCVKTIWPLLILERHLVNGLTYRLIRPANSTMSN